MIALTALIPTIAAAVVARLRGFRAALVFVALPSLLFFPMHYELQLPGLPDAGFANYTMIAVLVALFAGRDKVLLRFGSLDLIVLAYALLVIITEYANKNFDEARNMTARVAAGAVAPYIFGRTAAQRDGLRLALLGMIVIAAVVIGVLAPYEARMGTDPFDWMRGRWPGGNDFTRTLYRNGMRRVEGPFSQPICQGLFFAMVLPVALWVRARIGERRKVIVIPAAFAMLAGLVLTQSRGPMLGAAAMTISLFAAWSPRRAAIFTVVAVVGGLALIGSWKTISDSWFITRAEARTEEEHSAAYRFEMLDNYLEYVAERPLGGFGRNQIPVVRGQDSIDNQYLFLSLTHGVPAAAVYLLGLLLPAAAAIRAALCRAAADMEARLAFALGIVLIGTAVVQISVYAGTQTEPLLFLFEGLAVGGAQRMRAGSAVD